MHSNPEAGRGAKAHVPKSSPSGNRKQVPKKHCIRECTAAPRRAARNGSDVRHCLILSSVVPGFRPPRPQGLAMSQSSRGPSPLPPICRLPRLCSAAESIEAAWLIEAPTLQVNESVVALSRNSFASRAFCNVTHPHPLSVAPLRGSAQWGCPEAEYVMKAPILLPRVKRNA